MTGLRSITHEIAYGGCLAGEDKKPLPSDRIASMALRMCARTTGELQISASGGTLSVCNTRPHISDAQGTCFECHFPADRI